MILDIVESVDGVPIRLTDERWFNHILDEHPEMSGHYENVLGTIENPLFILQGKRGSKIAVENFGRHRWLHVAYREISQADGFIISAFFVRVYEEDKIIWQRGF